LLLCPQVYHEVAVKKQRQLGTVPDLALILAFIAKWLELFRLYAEIEGEVIDKLKLTCYISFIDTSNLLKYFEQIRQYAALIHPPPL